MPDNEQTLVLQALGDLTRKSNSLERRLIRVEKLLNMPQEEPDNQSSFAPVIVQPVDNAPLASTGTAPSLPVLPPRLASSAGLTPSVTPVPTPAPTTPVPTTVTPSSALPPTSTLGRLPEPVPPVPVSSRGAARDASETAGPVIIPTPEPARLEPKVTPASGAKASSTVPATRPMSTAVPAKAGLSLGDWEKIIGGQWALWLGCLSIFLAIAWLLAFAWGSLQPWHRVALGLAGGTAMMGAGAYFRPRVARWWSEGLLGSGMAVCYMSLWAAGPYYKILSFEATFLSMAGLTALGVVLALCFDSGELAFLSALGGFATPLFLNHYGSAHDYSLLVYLAVLNGGIVSVSLFKRWRSLVWLAFSFTVFLSAAWFLSASTGWGALLWHSVFGVLFCFLTLYFLMFGAAACFYSVYRNEETAPQDLGLLFAASAIYSPCAYFLIEPYLGNYPGLFPLGMAWFYGALALLLPRNRTLRESLAGLGLLALTVAFPIQFGGSALLVGWTMEAAVLLVLARRLEMPNFRRAGQIVWMLKWIPFVTQVLKVSYQHPGTITPFFNANALSLAFALGVSLFLAIEARDDDNRQSGDRLAHSYGTTAVLGGAYLVFQEMALWLANTKFLLFGLASAEILFALAAFFIGLQVRVLVVRVCSLFLLGGAVASLVALTSYTDAYIWTPFLNLRCVASVVAVLAVWAVWFLMGRKPSVISGAEAQSREFWQLLGAGLPLLGLSQELYFALPHLSSLPGFTFFALSALWALYSTGLLTVAFSSSSLRALATVIFSISAATLLLTALLSHFGGVPFVNPRLGAFIVTIACCFWSAWTSHRQRNQLKEWEGEWPGLLFFTGLLLVLWAMTQETIHCAHYWGRTLSPEPYQWALRTISLVWSLYAAALLEVGLKRRIAPVATGLRWLAYLIGLAGLTALLWHSSQAKEIGWPFFNGLSVTFVATIALWFWGAHRLAIYRDELDASERACPQVLLFEGISLLLWFFTQQTIHTSHALAQTHQWAICTLSLLWTVFAAALLQLGLLPHQNSASTGLRRMAYIVGSVGVSALLWNAVAALPGTMPFTHWLAGTFAITIVLWFWSARSLYQQRERLGKAELTVPHIVLFGGLGLLLWFLTQETLNTTLHLGKTLGSRPERWAQMGISLVWSLFGAALLVSGIAKRFQPLRLAGLGLLAITAVKVFVFDLSFLDGPSRIFSFGGFGLALIFISWLYGRYGIERETPPGDTENSPSNESDNGNGVGNGPHIGHGQAGAAL